jgi:hypothetical protein
MSTFVLAHLHDDGAALLIMGRDALQMPIQMCDDLSFGLGDETEAPFVADAAGRRTDQK